MYRCLLCVHVCVHVLFQLHRYMKRLIKIFRHKEETEEDVYTRWEKDFDLVPNSQHGLFYEYLELGVFAMHAFAPLHIPRTNEPSPYVHVVPRTILFCLHAYCRPTL